MPHKNRDERRAYFRKWAADNPEKIASYSAVSLERAKATPELAESFRQRSVERVAKWRAANRAKVNEAAKLARKANPEKHKLALAKHIEANRDKINARNSANRKENRALTRAKSTADGKRHYHSNVNNRISQNLRVRMRHALNYQSVKRQTSVYELVGCTISQLRCYLEGMFKEGMSWENRRLWHIDHIKPCALFDLRELDRQKECFHYTNLQPLWAGENMKKGKRHVVA